MAAQILDGKALAQKVRARVKAGVDELGAAKVTPGLAVVLVGDDPASAVYVRNKEAAAKECGVQVFDHKLRAETTEAELLTLVEQLNEDPFVDGILVQLPLPPQIDAKKILHAISPAKDVDGFHPVSQGLLGAGTPDFVPCTPKGCMALLHEANAQLRGARALVVGRSTIVGRPMAQLLLMADATVTIAHSRTKDLAEEVGRAEILVVAIGRAKAIKGEWVREGAIVIDVGMNRDEHGKLCGDVDFASAKERASFITPVPGGVGPMTIAMLLDNTLLSAQRRAKR
jgi:methylenetetrahydrofolate dehydrogenase (NADP+) / methenyltetrahydrofolate cyclohydrolase